VRVKVGDRVVYYREAHSEAHRSMAREGRGDTFGTPPWLHAPHAPPAVPCTVTAVHVRFPADWAILLRARMDAVLAAGFLFFFLFFFFFFFLENGLS